MKKITGFALLVVLGLSAAWAGDVATFVDKGFSEDGKYYVFGQYGKTDKKFQGWAELYQVDIAANDYTDNGVFKTKPSAVTADKTGTDESVFKDFRSADLEKADVYDIKLYPTVNGYGKNARSSFYIMLEKKNADGEVIMSRKIGNPDISRKGVTNYKIERIFCDKSEKNLIFVIEKMMEDDTGTSIRYMVEAAKF